MKPYLKNIKSDKSACVNMFSELLLTEEFQHYFRMIATPYFDRTLIYIH